MTYTLTRRFDFAASHVLPGLPPGHPCGRLHGHNWSVTLVLAADTVDTNGFVVDLLDLEPFRRLIDEEYEHRHLNDVVDVSPTSENLARHLYGIAHARWPQVVACAVAESSNAVAVYSPAGVIIVR